MKKNLLLAALVLPLLSVSAQWTQVGGTVVVKPNTLKYVSYDYSVKGTSYTHNEGHVNVRGNFDVIDATDGGTPVGFYNIWTGRNAYGQLIVNSAKATGEGKIINQYGLPGQMDFLSIAFPFKNYTADEAAVQTGIATPNYVTYVPGPDDGFMQGRYESTVWTWNNSDGDPKNFFFENIDNASTVLSPELYHGINAMDTPPSGTKNYKGAVNNVDANVEAKAYEMSTSWDVNNRGELYASYVEDVEIAKPADWRMATNSDGEQNGVADGVAANGYGDNIALFGNPFTSNMKINGKDGNVTLTNVSKIFAINANTYEFGDYVDGYGQTGTGNYKVATLQSDGTWATGAEDPLIVRPHGTFFVKTTGDATLSLNENTKTFENSSFDLNVANRTNEDNGFYQVTLELYNELGNYAYNDAYIFASDVIQPNTISRFEAYNNTFENIGFYSLQENVDGTIDESIEDGKVLINGVNATDYVAKPIHLVFAGNGEFTVKMSLTDNLNNSGNIFYFEDKQVGEIFEVTPDFEYTFTNNGTATDRFVMYWNGTPDVLAVDNVATVSQTLVYKDNKEFKVRFDAEWNTADIYVYNVLGQLVHTAKGVNTVQDYTLPLKGQTSAYIVKAIGDNGEVSTKKIIKQ